MRSHSSQHAPRLTIVTFAAYIVTEFHQAEHAHYQCYCITIFVFKSVILQFQI